MTSRDRYLEMIPAYALGALDEQDRAEFEHWLASDPDAQRELAAYQAVSESLVLLTPARQAPTHLTSDLRARLAVRRAASPSGLEPQAEPPPSAPTLTVTRTQKPESSVQWRWAAAAAAIVLVIAGAIFLNTQRPVDMGAQMYADISSQPDMVEIALLPEGSHVQMNGKLVATADGMEAVIAVEALPNLQPDQTFQLWLVKNGEVSSGGLFRKTGDMTYIMLPLDASVLEYDAFGVSIEPEGGSPMQDQPSGPQIFAVPMKT